MKILIAEDTEDSRIMLEMALEAEGYEVTSAENGLEALEFARQNIPDLIVSDIMMPKMDGFEFCRQVKKDPALSAVPFIFYTATYTDDRDRELAFAVGAARFVIKPQEPQKLVEIIRETIDMSKKKQSLSARRPMEDELAIEEMHLHTISKKLDKKIHELDQQRHALVQSEDRYRKLVEALQDYYFFYTRDKNGQMIYVSPSEELILGYELNDFCEHFLDYLTSNAMNENAEDLFELSLLGREQKPYPLEIYHKDGSKRYIEVKEIPVFNDKKELLQVEGIVHDITEQRRAEEVIRRTQKMASLGKLTGGVAHDYNNILGVVMGYAEILSTYLQDNPELAGYVNEILHAAERGTKLSSKLLGFSRRKAIDTELVDINNLLRENENMLQKSLTARIRLHLELADDLWQVDLDSSDFEDAILNLCINSMHAIEGHGELSIRTTNKSLDSGQSSILEVPAGDYVLVSITDTGCGMDRETKDSMFEPFFSTKGEKGTGLGLSQVYGFIKRSHGAVKVYSEPGFGTCFNLYFPRSVSDIQNKDESTEKKKDRLNGTETILVVDDEPALLNITKEILTSHGYKFYCAESAEQALKILGEEKIDLLLTDIIMPEMDGIELKQRVEDKFPQVKILLASGYSHHTHNGDSDYSDILINKPYSATTLLKKIRTTLDNSQ